MALCETKQPSVIYVWNLKTALDAYWTARSRREQQAAYHEILLFGGIDGYSNFCWKGQIARALRRAALCFEEG